MLPAPPHVKQNLRRRDTPPYMARVGTNPVDLVVNGSNVMQRNDNVMCRENYALVFYGIYELKEIERFLSNRLAHSSALAD
jgi:hypothetical protein